MSDEDDVLQKADALMRRRSFVAGANQQVAAVPTPEPQPAPQADDDVPLLTEVVAPEDVPPPPLPGIDMAALRETIAAEMEAWLDRELPAQVQRVLDGLTDRLIIELSAAARADLTPRVLEILSAAAPAKPDPTDD